LNLEIGVATPTLAPTYQLSPALLEVIVVFCAEAETVSIAAASIKNNFFIVFVNINNVNVWFYTNILDTLNGAK
jgi:hypothetical protein